MSDSSNLYFIFADHQFSSLNQYLELNFDSQIKLNILVFQNNPKIELINKKFINNVTIFKPWKFKLNKHNRTSYNAFRSFLLNLNSNSKVKSIITPQLDTDVVLLSLAINKPSVFVLLDDGSASILFNQKRTNSLTIKLLIKSVIYGTLLKQPKIVQFHSKYQFLLKCPDDKLINYTDAKNYMVSPSINSTKWIHLGSNLVKSRITTKSNYLKYLQKIKNRLEKYEIEYYPHRNESQEMLNLIKQLGFKVNKSDLPFETKLTSFEYLPVGISSHYYASVLINILDRYSLKSKIVAFQDELIHPRIDKRINHAVYEQLILRGINLEKLSK